MAACSLNPLFILGPGRSGTTLLYKLLCLHPDVAFISNYDTHRLSRPFAKIALAVSHLGPATRRRAWFSAEGQAYLAKRALLHRLVPMPVEGEAVYQACGLTLNETLEPVDEEIRARLRARFSRVQRRHPAGMLVLKRTANNRRIPALDSSFPEAKYVVIWRDGRAVALSLTQVHWWLDNHVWWAGGKRPRDMNLDRQGMLELAATNWLQEVMAIKRGLATVAPARVLTVRYEALVENLEKTVASILEFCGQRVPPELLGEISSIGLRPGGKPWKLKLSAREISAIEQIQSAQLRDLSYL
jgi:hypothetical protein